MKHLLNARHGKISKDGSPYEKTTNPVLEVEPRIFSISLTPEEMEAYRIKVQPLIGEETQ